jgi:hypothetical protein
MLIVDMRTSPVNVEFDLLLHVPMSCGSGTPCACTCSSATPESSSAAILDTIVCLCMKDANERVYAVGDAAAECGRGST